MKGNERKPHIGILGRRNAGKSSFLNYISGQQLSIVSPTAGTTTDPVSKSMELLGIGPVVWIDTAGIDDEGELGTQRVARSLEVLPQCDLVVLVFTAEQFGSPEVSIIDRCKESKIPILPICSKCDILSPADKKNLPENTLFYNIYDNSQLETIQERIREELPESAYVHKSLLGDIIKRGDNIVLVCPIDSSAPEGRLILPQVQVIRDILDHGAKAFVCQVDELQQTLDDLKQQPTLVITDSQAFAKVSTIVPPEIPLTSFSIVLARAKGLFDQYIKGTFKLDSLQEGDRILMLESCTHTVTCEDIGRNKLPKLIQKHSGRNLEFDCVAGLSALTRPISDYALVIQCGGCVVTPKQLSSRLSPALSAGIPVSNYGLALAHINGILKRSIEPFIDNNKE